RDGRGAAKNGRPGEAAHGRNTSRCAPCTREARPVRMSAGRPSRDGGLALGRPAKENAAVIPVGDQDTSGGTGIPYVNIAIVAINILVFLYQLTSPDFTNGYSTVPAEITHGVDIVGPQTLQLPDGTAVQIDEAPG